MLFLHQKQTKDMMREDDNFFSVTLGNGLLDECEATLMFLVEVICC